MVYPLSPHKSYLSAIALNTLQKLNLNEFNFQITSLHVRGMTNRDIVHFENPSALYPKYYSLFRASKLMLVAEGLIMDVSRNTPFTTDNITLGNFFIFVSISLEFSSAAVR